MAFRFLELCREGIRQEATGRLYAARKIFYDCIESAWEALVKHKKIPEETLTNITRLSRYLAATALQLTDELFPYCGMAAAGCRLMSPSLRHLLLHGANACPN
jgi:hypothetical protein